MNINFLDITLLCSNVFFATIIVIIMIIKIRQKKVILNAFQKSKNLLKAQIVNDEAVLKNARGETLSPELEKKIIEIISVEKDSYNSLLNLFVDYHPASIEMMPVLMNKITTSYIQYIEQIMRVNGVEQPKEVNSQLESNPQSDGSPCKAVLEGDPSGDEYQYEALIEQLRFEKQDFANKYKNASNLLETIYLTYKDKLEIKGPEKLENMNLTEIAKIFNI
jgi:hypothetical protein